MVSEKRKNTTVSIHVQLYEKIKEMTKTTGFTSVSDYVNYIYRKCYRVLRWEKEDEFSQKKKRRSKRD